MAYKTTFTELVNTDNLFFFHESKPQYYVEMSWAAAVLWSTIYAVPTPTDLLCRGECAAQLEDESPFTLIPPPAAKLAPKAFSVIPLGSITTEGWMREQLILQANALEGAMPISTFPGAITVNGSTWVGGKGSDGCSQWLPYWTNGAVPMLELLRPDAEAMSRLDRDFGVVKVIDAMMEYVLAHTNKSTSGPGAGWIGPFENEPGDSGGHGLWDPLNMLRTLLNYAQAHADEAKAIAKACIAHLTAEAKLLHTDPVISWASTRWPTFVEICQYSIDVLVPEFGADRDVMPLGAEATTTLLLNASQLFRVKGMNWTSYYHQTGAVKFPETSVPTWNTNDHGVNNAEGAMRWPSVAYRMSGGAASDRKEQDFMLGMLDKWQGQVTALFCADEVFCGRAAHRGTVSLFTATFRANTPDNNFPCAPPHIRRRAPSWRRWRVLSSRSRRSEMPRSWIASSGLPSMRCPRR